MSGVRFAFLDWLKVAGMALIIFGHTGGGGVEYTAPFYPKQLGVAFFVYAMGYTLAQDRKSNVQILFHRLFDVYLIGILCALGIAAISFWHEGKLSKSNFLPFLLGANTLYNFFPANPTTWFIGTYLHLLILGSFVFRRLRWNGGWLVGVAVLEIATRAIAMRLRGDFFAYMSVANWTTVFGLGCWAGQSAAAPESNSQSRRNLTPIAGLAGLACLPLIWSFYVGNQAWDDGFPFRRLKTLDPMTANFVASACVTMLYFTYTWLSCRVAAGLPRWSMVEFLSRHTLLVFILHMPLVYAISPTLYRFVPEGIIRHTLHQVLYFGGLAALSACVYRVVRPRVCRDSLGRRLGLIPADARGEPSIADS